MNRINEKSKKYGMLVILMAASWMTPLIHAEISDELLLEKAYFYTNSKKDTLFLAYKFNRNPGTPTHFVLKEQSLLIIEFSMADIPKSFKPPEGQLVVRNMKIEKELINNDIKVVRTMIEFERMPPYEFRTRGNYVIVGFDLVHADPRTLPVTAEKKLDSLNRLLSYSKTPFPEQLNLDILFSIRPSLWVRYKGNKKNEIIYDFYNAVSEVDGRKRINISPVENIVFAQRDLRNIKRVRLKISTFEKAYFSEAVIDNKLIITLESEGWSLADEDVMNAYMRTLLSVGLSVFTIVYGMARILIIG